MTSTAGATAGQGFTFGVGEALSIAQLGFGITQSLMGDRVREQQIYNQSYQTEFNNQINQFRTEQINQQRIEAFNAKLDFTKQQIENNFLAAESAWTAEQMRLNEIYGRAAFKSQSMQKMLEQAVGSAAAREVYGKSARRGALVSTLGAYGRSRAQLAEQLMSESTAAQMRMQQVEKQKRARDKLTIAQTSVLPVAAAFSPTPMPSITGGGFGQALTTGLGIGLQAFQTGYGMTPEGGDFFGIQRNKRNG